MAPFVPSLRHLSPASICFVAAWALPAAAWGASPAPVPAPQPPAPAIASPRTAPVLRPWLQVANAAQPVRLAGLRVDAQVVGQVARTTLEMRFFNPNNRVLEGQLQFPLLPGQEVTAFALDIDGTWRDAVPVEKDKGRQVFEDVTRQRIDPALLEQTQGNQFRLRVYPLPANGTRRVRMTITERLQPAANGQAQWRLPLPQGEVLDQFSGSITVAGADAQRLPALQGVKDAGWQATPTGAQAQWQSSRSTLPQALELGIALPATPVVLLEHRAGTSYFYADVPAPQVATAPRAAPQRIALVWDASGSGAKRDHARELALLDAYFKAIGNTQVNLTLARDVAEVAGTFTISNGNWQALRQVLQNVAYDGATSIAALQPTGQADVALLVTDGLVNYGTPAATQATMPVLAVYAATGGDVLRLQQLVRSSGGVFVDVGSVSAEQGARLLQTQPVRVKVEGAGISDVVTSEVNAQGRVAVAGKLGAGVSSLPLRWQLPDGKVQTQAIHLPQTTSANPLAAGMWARMMVDELSSNYHTNKPRITQLGKEFGLVTKATSLIVLDRVEDYVRHDIVPPAPLLQAFTQQKMQQKMALVQDEKRHLEDIVRRFGEKQAWWNKSFPKDTPPAPKPQLQDNSAMPAAPVAAGIDAEMADTSSLAETRPRQQAQVAAASAVAAPAPALNRARSAEFASAKAAAPATGNAAASIQLKQWAPDSPYSRRLRNAQPNELYAIYLQERSAYQDSTAFYLDVADIFFAQKQPMLALRILSNLAEMDLENRHILRILGYRLMQAKRADWAIPVLEKVLELAPDEPQSWRDVGLARAQSGQHQKAVDALYEVVRKPWHDRFPDIELIALAELNAIVAQAKTKIDTSAIDPRLLKNLPLDMRVVLTWDADNTDIDLWVTDPNGEKVFYGHPQSYQGGRISRDFTGGYGPEEFSLKKAKPGKYVVQAQFYGHRQQIVAPATTLQMELFTNFGKPGQKSQAVTLRLAGQSETVMVGEFVVK